MSAARPLKLFFVGESRLLLECLKIARQRGHWITGIVTTETDTEDVPRFSRVSEAIEHCRERPDVLLSIVCRNILADDVIHWPSLAAVNYHNSALPAFAGVSAASAALLSAASQHGVTWHLMVPLFDAGDILVQRRFPIAPDDTALSLNARCFEAAIESFSELLSGLEMRQLLRTRQNLGLRTVHRFSDRLAGNGILDWSQHAGQLCRFVRASDCYPHENLIGSAAILLTDHLAVRVRSCRLLHAGPQTIHAPGTILSATANRIEVAAKGGQLLLHLYPQSLTPGASPALHYLSPGHILPAITPELHKKLEDTGKESVGRERQTVDRLRDLPAPLRPLGLRYGITAANTSADRSLICCIAVPPHTDSWRTATQILGRLATLSDQPRCTAAILRKNPPPSFLDRVPVAVTAAAIEATHAELQHARQQPWISDDLFIRWPILRRQALAVADIRVFLTEDHPSDFTTPGLLLEVRADEIRFWGFLTDFSSTSLSELQSAVSGATTQQITASTSPDVVSMFLETIRTSPDHPCVEQNGVIYTRREILQRARRIATGLIVRGAGAESRVVVAMSPSADYVACILGILMAGAAFVPVDTAASLHRAREIIEDCRPLCVISASDGVPVTDLTPCIAVAELTSELVEFPDIRSAAADSAAYLLYTSGSTGRPKGAVIERKALGVFIRTVLDRQKLHPADRILQLCSLAFDASIEEIFSSICSGATLILKPDDLLESARMFLQRTAELRLTVIGIYPAMLSPVLDIMESTHQFPETVRLLTTGGEQVPMNQVKRWREFFATRDRQLPALINVYGLTETTIANFHCNLSTCGDTEQPAPIGYPLPENCFRLVSDLLQDDSEIGELLLAGSQLARCYWERPELNTTRFVTEPETGNRWFRTGDLARRLPDGSLLILGRCDQQIKVSGVRVEPEEVERALERTPGVKQAAVVTATFAGNSPALFAFVCPNDPQLLTAVRMNLLHDLPSAMQPREIFGLAQMPLTDRGKIAKDELLQQAKQSHFAQHGTTPAADGPLVNAWRDVLGQSPEDGADFVQQGGDSLAALKLLLRVEEITGVRIAVSEFLQDPTLPRLQTLTDNPQVELLRQLKAGHDGLPLVFLHGVSGDIAEFEELSRRMTCHSSIYGIRSRICFTATDPPGSIEQFAEEAFSHIRQIHDTRPPILASWSWGGLLVWHVAHLYRQHYGTRPILVMIDTVCPGRIPASFKDKILYAAAQTPAALLLRTKKLASQFRNPTPAAGKAETLERLLRRQLQQSLIRMGDRYIPPRDTCVRLHMLKATITELGPRAWSFPQRLRDNGWSHFTGCRPIVHTRRCTHTDLVWTQQVEWTAKCLSQICEQETARFPLWSTFRGQ